MVTFLSCAVRFPAPVVLTMPRIWTIVSVVATAEKVPAGGPEEWTANVMTVPEPSPIALCRKSPIVPL